MNLGMQILKCLAACTVSGFAAGTIAAAATAQTTDSVQTPGQVLVLTALLGSCFAAAFVAAGAALLAAMKLVRSRTSSTADNHETAPVTGPQLALVIFLLWGGLVGGLWLHDIALGDPLPGWLFRPLLVLGNRHGGLARRQVDSGLTKDPESRIRGLPDCDPRHRRRHDRAPRSCP